MPRRKRSSAATAGGSGETSVSNTEFLAPGGGTSKDINKLSRTLNLPVDTVTAIMNCGGQGVASSGGRSSSRRSAGGADDLAVGGGVDPAMMNVWGDFMSEEMSAPAPAAASAAAAKKKEEETTTSSKPAAASAEPVSTGPRSYILPIEPRMSLTNGKKKSSSNNDDDDVPTPGLLAQTGTLDASVPGRSTISKNAHPHELQTPTLLFPTSIFKNKQIAYIATSPTACHSIAITSTGEAYGWGRNETGQLGLGYTSSVVPLPTLLSIAGENDSIKFVGAGVGKYHTILVGSNGLAYASGGNICGQLGINNMGVKGIDKFRKCVVVGQIESEGEDDKMGDVKIVQASCGENISALLSSTGHLYTTGSSEFGQLGNGETGEYIITAGKLGYANCAKFIRRSVFVQSESDAESGFGMASNLMTGKGVDSAGKIKCVTLEDSSSICLANIACGKNHIVAVEASSEGHKQVPRVFTWGSGDYGCLGHGIQADEYHPRLVGSMRGPIFANNHPVSAVAGANCSLVLTKHGHVYYVGKHKTAGEATMRFTLVDALANNGHVVTSIGAGSQTVFCSTKSGVTVSWGQGSHGELGYGKDNKKSSSKPEFVGDLDSCLVTSVSCGMGHTLFIVRDEDEEDAKALKKVAKVEKDDVADFVEQIKGKKVDAGDDGGEPAKKKQKGKGKK